MSTFVLVHGAWQGASSWDLVVPKLRMAGHQVFTPVLTGLGEDSHRLSPALNLDSHMWKPLSNLFLSCWRADAPLVSVLHNVFRSNVKTVRQNIQEEKDLPSKGDSLERRNVL